jgi:hypothetical protein
MAKRTSPSAVAPRSSRSRGEATTIRSTPDSGIEHSDGDQWPPPWIDYWIYVDPAKMVARLSVEGWNGGDQIVDVSGHGPLDGQLLATAFAAFLRVPPTDEGTSSHAAVSVAALGAEVGPMVVGHAS